MYNKALVSEPEKAGIPSVPEQLLLTTLRVSQVEDKLVLSILKVSLSSNAGALFVHGEKNQINIAGAIGMLSIVKRIITQLRVRWAATIIDFVEMDISHTLR